MSTYISVLTSALPHSALTRVKELGQDFPSDHVRFLSVRVQHNYQKKNHHEKQKKIVKNKKEYKKLLKVY